MSESGNWEERGLTFQKSGLTPIRKVLHIRITTSVAARHLEFREHPRDEVVGDHLGIVFQLKFLQADRTV